jgi:cysteine synthase
MSKERFEWLEKMGSEIIPTPGTESNVKAIFDKVQELEREYKGEVVTMNQFCEFMNPIFHYNVTGPAMEEVWATRAKGTRLSGVFLTQGSAGCLASADYLKSKHPLVKLGVGEALQCPTLLENGYGDHRIEGIGDKHVPWVHNLKSTDLVASIDDEAAMRLVCLFNTDVGKAVLASKGVPQSTIDSLKYLGISGCANVIGAMKLCKYYEFTEKDTVFTVATDSFEMYGSRLEEMEKSMKPAGKYTILHAEMDFFRYIEGCTLDYMMECRYTDRRRMHQLKYYTWVEQQGKNVRELDAQWYDDTYWVKRFGGKKALDARIVKFNEMTGFAAKYPTPTVTVPHLLPCPHCPPSCTCGCKGEKKE